MTNPVSPTPIDLLPPAPEPTDTPAEFDSKGFATVSAQAAMIPQINNAISKTYQNAVASEERAVEANASKDAAALSATASASSATAASGSASSAATSATNAENSASASAASASAASDSESAAAASENAAAASATTATEQAVIATEAAEAAQSAASGQISGTSTTSITPGTGVKTFAIEPGRSFITGMYVVATSESDTSVTMTGLVQSYNAITGDLVVEVHQFTGSATKADWAIGVAARSANGLVQRIIISDTTAISGELYLINAANVKLTLPATPAHGDMIGIRLVADVSRSQIIDFGDVDFRGQVAGERFINSRGFGLDIQYNSTLGEWA